MTNPCQDGLTAPRLVQPAHQPLLCFEHVRFSYAQGLFSSLFQLPAGAVVEDVSFAIHRGDSVGLIGESGSGKTTVARLALDLERPTEGTVSVEGAPLPSVPRRRFRQLIQPVFQDPLDALDPRMRIGDQVAEPLIVQRLCSRAEARAEALSALDRVGLDGDIADRLPHQISGGQAQRVVIARALVLKPALLICDEPVSALDMSVQVQILNLLKDLKSSTGLTYLFISHDLRAVSYLCRHLMVIYRGTIVEQGSTAKILAAPRHPYTRSLLAAVPKAAGEALSALRPADREPPYRDMPDGPGCIYARRCTIARQSCLSERPALQGLAEDHAVACPIAREDMANSAAAGAVP